MLRKLLDRPIAVTMIAVVLLILGIVSSRLLPVSLVPDVDAPYITVQIPAQGLSTRQLDDVPLCSVELLCNFYALRFLSICPFLVPLVHNIIKALIAICCMLNDCLNLIITAVVNVQF